MVKNKKHTHTQDQYEDILVDPGLSMTDKNFL